MVKSVCSSVRVRLLAVGLVVLVTIAGVAPQMASSQTKAAPKRGVLSLEGTRVDIPTLDDYTMEFVGQANTWVRFRGTRNATVGAPYAGTGFNLFPQRSDQPFDTAVLLDTTGTYVLGLPAVADDEGWIEAKTISEPPVRQLAPGSSSFELVPGQPQWGLLPVKGGQRYRLEAFSNEASASFCILSQALDASFRSYTHPATVAPPATFAQVPTATPVGPAQPPLDKPYVSGWSGEASECAPVAFSPTSSTQPAPVTFIPLYDQTLIVYAYARAETLLEGRITPVAADRIVDPKSDGSVQAASTPLARTILPLWGPASQRAIIASPVADYVAAYGEPWIERETNSRQYLVPTQFRANVSPFIGWGGGSSVQDLSLLRFQGDDDVFPIAVGAKIATVNKPWMRSVVPFTLVQGRRYQLSLKGANLNDAGFAVRETNGRRVTAASTWSYDEAKDGEIIGATTVLDARHGGQWALEIDPRSAIVSAVDVTLVEVDGRTAYEPVTNVKIPVTPGDAADVDLLPGEWAQIVFNTGNRAVTVEPVVLRYRNSTFDLTAADVTIWDPEGRLVFSNNKDLQEEVFSGRLGKESNGAERFVLLRPKTSYRVVVDPVGDLAGRFRLSMRSADATDIVPVDPAKGTTLTAAEMGILEVRNAPISVKVKGSACFKTSTLGVGDICLTDQSVTLPPGLHSILTSGTAAITSAPLGSGRIATEQNYVVGATELKFSGPTLVKVTLSEPGLLYPVEAAGSVTVLGPDGVPLVVRRTQNGVGIVPDTAGEHTLVFSQAGRVQIAAPIDLYVRESIRLGVSTTRVFVPGQRVLYRITLTGPSRVDVITTSNRAGVVGLFKPNGENAGSLSAGTYDVMMIGDGLERFTIKATRLRRSTQFGRANNTPPTAPPASV